MTAPTHPLGTRPGPSPGTHPAAPAPSATDVQRGRRRLGLRGTFLLFATGAGIGLVAAFAGNLQGELLIGVAFAIVIVGDLIGAYRAFGDPAVDVSILGNGQVGVDMGIVVSVRGSRQPLWVRVGWWYPRWFTVAPDRPGWARLRPNARGTIRWLDVDLVGRGPLGLWKVGRRDRIRFPRPVAVAPPPVAHEIDFPPLPVRPFGEATLTRGADDLTRGVRDYRPGDPRKLVHWPASAHHGRLLVRETETLGTTRVRIAVITPLAGAASEVALARAAWLVRECLARGWEVELLTTERREVHLEPDLPRRPFASQPGCSLVHDSISASGITWAMPWPGQPGAGAAPMAYGPPPGHRPPGAPGSGEIARSGAWVPATTRRDDVRSVVELDARLAVVAPGHLDLPADRVTTRIVGSAGDEWRR